MSKVDIDELFKLTSQDRVMRYYIKEYERLMKYRLPACSLKQNKIVEQILVILDMEGIGLSIFGSRIQEFIKIAADLASDYYPETLGKMFIINTNFFFTAIWTLVKGFIAEKTRNKMVVTGYDYQSQLLENVDEENLPVFFGGKCTCSHIEGGCLLSDIGPWNSKGGYR